MEVAYSSWKKKVWGEIWLWGLGLGCRGWNDCVCGLVWVMRFSVLELWDGLYCAEYETDLRVSTIL